MFLRCKVRRKDGKQHRYWSVVENTWTARGRVVQRHVLYLGEINDTQERQLEPRLRAAQSFLAEQPIRDGLRPEVENNAQVVVTTGSTMGDPHDRSLYVTSVSGRPYSV